MLTIFGSDVSPLIKFPLFLIAILAIVGIFYVVLRRMTGGRLVSSGPEQGRSRQPRLGVVDVYDLDRTRQLVLLRRDNVEHLLLIGGPNDTVIETNIVRVAGGKQPMPPEMQLERTEPPAMEPIPVRPFAEQPLRPVIEGAFAKPAASERPVFSEPPYAPAPVAPVASQAAVSAASFAAVAAATQHKHEAETVEVPDFLRTPHDHHAGGTKTFAHEAPEESIMRHRPSYAEPQPLHIEPEPSPYTAQKPIEPIFPTVPPLLPLQQPEPEPAPYVEPLQTAPVFVQEPHLEPEPAPVPVADFMPVSDFPVTPTLEPEATSEPETAIEPEPVPVPAMPERTEDHWSKQTPFAGLDTSIGDYSKFPVPMEFQPEPVEPVEPAVEEHISSAVENEPAPEPEQEHATTEAPLRLDESVFSDMARQLEEALARKHAGAEAEQRAVSAPETPAEPAAPDITEAILDIAKLETPAPRHEPAAEHSAIEPAIEPAPVAAPPASIALPAEPATDEAEPKAEPAAKKDDPFSLDDIEAEFARLLGRTEQSGKS